MKLRLILKKINKKFDKNLKNLNKKKTNTLKTVFPTIKKKKKKETVRVY